MSRPFQFFPACFPPQRTQSPASERNRDLPVHLKIEPSYVEDLAAQPQRIQAVRGRYTIYPQCIASKIIAALKQLTRCEPISDR
jgi:hypothetical protein